jgi:hypothetical protein
MWTLKLVQHVESATFSLTGQRAQYMLSLQTFASYFITQLILRCLNSTMCATLCFRAAKGILYIMDKGDMINTGYFGIEFGLSSISDLRNRMGE